MYKQKLNPKVLQHFQNKTTQEAGFMCLLNLAKAQGSLTEVSSKVQRYSRIEEFNYRRTIFNAAVLIQKCMKRYFAIKNLKSLKLEREIKIQNAKATIIQSFYRKRLAIQHCNFMKLKHKLLNLREAAAVCIQKNYRIKLLQHKLHILNTKCLLLKIRSQAATTIQKTLRAHFVRKDLYFIRNKKLSLLVTWVYPAQSVSLYGDFTHPPWKLELPLIYSKHLKAFYTVFFIESNLAPGRYFLKFIVDHSWACNGNLPIEQDIDGNHNNVLVISMKRNNEQKTQSLDQRILLFNTNPFKKKRAANSRLSPLNSNFICEKRENSSILLLMKTYQISYPKKRNAELSGENSADACVVSEEMQMFALADGVNEWETFGLDPVLFPNELIWNFVETFWKHQPDENLGDLEICGYLELILSEAYEKVKAYGSSTVFLGLCRNNKLYTLSLGDSGLLILRKNEPDHVLNVIYRSLEQKHSFNCPYQLSNLPVKEKYEFLKEKGLNSLVSLLINSRNTAKNLPKDARAEVIPLQPLDIIVAGSDGLFDNLFDDDIKNISEKILELGLSPEIFCEKLAKELTIQANFKAWDFNCKSPFSKNASKYEKTFIGGKLDDISVVVAIAINEADY